MRLAAKQIHHKSSTYQCSKCRKTFAFLISTMRDVNPHIPVKERLSGVNPIAEAEAIIGAELPLVRNFEDFYYLVHRVLCTMRDQHCVIYDMPEALQKERPHIPQTAHKKSADFRQYDRYMYGGLFDFKFLNGKYYTVADYHGKADSKEPVLLPAGSEIITVNGRLIFDVINSKNLLPSSRWDYNASRYVNTALFPLEEYGLGESTLFRVKLPSADTVLVDFTGMDISTNTFLYTDNEDFKVQLFPDGLLYIRVPEMNLGKLEYLANELEKYRKKSIAKIAIDIRNNPGGNDELWINLISLLVSNPLEVQSEMLVRKSKTVQAYLGKYHKNLSIAGAPAYRSSLLPNSVEYVKLPNSTLSITPSSKSLGYNGTIYLLVNERCYSSALGFLTAVKGSKQFTSVGQRTGWFGGRGLTPFFFHLPHSEIIFSIEPVFDITGVKSLSQALQDAPDVELPLTLDDYIKESSYEGERFSKEFLYGFDRTFKYVLGNH